jgi:hypothetical protein
MIYDQRVNLPALRGLFVVALALLAQFLLDSCQPYPPIWSGPNVLRGQPHYM